MSTLPPPQTRGKLDKPSVHYRASTGHERCGVCLMYDDGTCSLVEGAVQDSHVCDFWQPKRLPTALSRVLLAAQAQDDEEAVHQHLLKQCPWYTDIFYGKNPGDPVNCKNCLSAGEKLSILQDGGLIELTPRTPEASTVDKPTVPAGGPGLFHVKGLHLPPYIQHLWFHLVKEYGKHKAYGVAVGVVKKWAAGINPGGKHPTRTHADVRAAAARNVAQWEADRAKGHAHVKATADPAAGDTSFPGHETVALPPTPRDAREMFTAHRIDDALKHLAHARERMSAGRKATSSDQRRYYSIHVSNHLTRVLQQFHMLADNLRCNYPAEARELEAVRQTLGLARACTPQCKEATTAHLTETVLHEATHGKRHALGMLNPDPKAVWDFNAEHAQRHLDGAYEHVAKLAEHIRDNYPAEARWLDRLEKQGSAHLQSAQHARYVRAMALAAPATSSLVPGRADQYGLHQVASQTVSPSPPTPPGRSVPTAKEVRAVIAHVPTGIDASLSRTARQFLETAAVKLSKHDEIEALAALRGAQAALYSASRKDAGAGMPAVFGAATAPPAERSRLLVFRQQQAAWRALSVEVGELIDRLRKNYFHGRVNGYLPNQRI